MLKKIKHFLLWCLVSLAALAGLYIVLWGAHGLFVITPLKGRVYELQEALEKLREERKKLEQHLLIVRQPRAQEMYARQVLQLGAPGEVMYVIPKVHQK